MFRRYMLLSLLAVSLGAGLSYSQYTVIILGKVIDCSGGVLPGVMVQAKNTTTSAQSTSTTNATGEFAFSGLSPAIYDVTVGTSTVTVDLRSRFWARVSVGCASTSGVVYSVGRSGPRAIHAFALRLPQCPHPNPAFSSATCVPNGDTLPAGPDALYSLSIFDTGSTILLVNNLDPQGISDAKYLKLCEPANDCQPTSTGNYPPYSYLPDSLDVLIWGLGAVNPTALTVPITTPQAQVAAIKVRPYSTPTLIGAPVAARVIAEINYRKILSRNFSFGLIEAADIAFYPENGAGIPTPSYQLQLEKYGPFGTSSSDGASTGPRYQLKNVVLSNQGNTVADGSTYQFLFDTGNTTTQATAAVAQALGIDLVNDTPVDTYTVNTTSGPVQVKGYFIDSFEITSPDLSHKYQLTKPILYVNPAGLGGYFDVNVGSNYFADAHILFDGPGSQLGIIEADGTVGSSGGSVTDSASGSQASITFPAGVLSGSTEATIIVLDNPPAVAPPVGFSGPGTYFVRIELDPEPSYPLPAPGATLVLPLLQAKPPGTTLTLYRMDPNTATLVPAVSVSGTNVVGTVDPGGLSATFTGIASFSNLVGLIPNLPPVAKCQNISVAADASCKAAASIDNGSSDPEGSPLTIAQVPPGPYFLGTTSVTLTVTDNHGAADTCSAVVTVADKKPPDIARLEVMPNVLWPPNNKMVPVTIAAAASDNCGTAICKIISVSSNEPPNSNALATGDAVKTGNLTLNLRAQRNGDGNGRIYTITVQCTDGSGNSQNKTLDVKVPHDQRK